MKLNEINATKARIHSEMNIYKVSDEMDTVLAYIVLNAERGRFAMEIVSPLKNETVEGLRELGFKVQMKFELNFQDKRLPILHFYHKVSW